MTAQHPGAPVHNPGCTSDKPRIEVTKHAHATVVRCIECGGSNLPTPEVYGAFADSRRDDSDAMRSAGDAA